MDAILAQLWQKVLSNQFTGRVWLMVPGGVIVGELAHPTIFLEDLFDWPESPPPEFSFQPSPQSEKPEEKKQGTIFLVHASLWSGGAMLNVGAVSIKSDQIVAWGTGERAFENKPMS